MLFSDISDAFSSIPASPKGGKKNARMSTLSEQTLDALAQAEAKLSSIEARVSEIVKEVPLAFHCDCV